MTPTKPTETLVNNLAKRIRQRIQTERLPDGASICPFTCGPRSEA